ncbi:MAG: chaperonin GroL [Parcubacteria group bacterium RIFCSPLOWO2_01_FULL_48_18]|nr:MAG: chaperonin GroL [Parcubacteria group bacterium RIFCSPHIGHO2_02_FULL_48_10b]OHB22678.1 MAG: chaperonin GroL [Parcubacteria group bacterium RIFCSPLOWO2_01_FULL_48_18]
MAKQILFHEKSHAALKNGIDKVANAVKVTLGPKGRNVIIDEGFGSPTITKDGVTVAKKIDLPNKTEKAGAELAKEVASKTADVAGDGTTTAVLLLQSMINEGFSQISSGSNPVLLRRGIEHATDLVGKELERSAEKILGQPKRVEEVASISANDAAVGKLIASVFNEIGHEGVVTVEESNTLGLSKEMVEGLQFDRGYVSPYMMTNPDRMEAALDEPYILVTDKKVSSINDILPVLEKVLQSGKKEMVIVAEEVEGEALATLVVNKIRGVFSVLAVKAPGFGDRRKEMLQDIAIVTGADFISEDVGRKLETVTLESLGKARRVISNKDNTTIVGGGGSKTEIEKRIKQIRAQLEKTDSEFDREKLQERLGKLSGGVAVIKVGGVTETEIKELKFRVEDAISATRAALEEGIVPGGGVALFEASVALNENNLKGITPYGDEMRGVEIVKRALQQPIKVISENAGKPGEDVFRQIAAHGKSGYGFNALTGTFADMKEAGIIDPVKVVKTALQNAASVAALILTSEALIADLPEKKGAPAGGMPSAMDDMDY